MAWGFRTITIRRSSRLPGRARRLRPTAERRSSCPSLSRRGRSMRRLGSSSEPRERTMTHLTQTSGHAPRMAYGCCQGAGKLRHGRDPGTADRSSILQDAITGRTYLAEASTRGKVPVGIYMDHSSRGQEFGWSEALCLELMWLMNDTNHLGRRTESRRRLPMPTATPPARGWAPALAEFDAGGIKEPRTKAAFLALFVTGGQMCKAFVPADPATIPPREFICNGLRLGSSSA